MCACVFPILIHGNLIAMLSSADGCEEFGGDGDRLMGGDIMTANEANSDPPRCIQNIRVFEGTNCRLVKAYLI